MKQESGSQSGLSVSLLRGLTSCVICIRTGLRNPDFMVERYSPVDIYLLNYWLLDNTTSHRYEGGSYLRDFATVFAEPCPL